MPKYVVGFSKELEKKVNEMDLAGAALIIKGEFQSAEKLFKAQYELIRSYEDRLPEGKRFHKGAPLHSLGFSIMLQNDPKRLAEAYQMILLAYVEDLFDYDTFEIAQTAPAYKTLLGNPFITPILLDLVSNQVRQMIEQKQIPKKPEDVLKPIKSKTEDATRKPIAITIDRIKYLVDKLLEQRGEKEKRVFVGGNYKNIALLDHIAKIIEEFGFSPITPIDLPETADPEFEQLIHDISIEMLRNCSYAVFEVSISNGHLMEIERAKDFKGHLKVVLVYQVHRKEDRPLVTKMLMSKDFEQKPYRNFSELTAAIHGFLGKT
jgi:hypothetical protein